MTSILLNHRIRKNAEHFEKLKAYASKNGFELLDTEWKGGTVKHFFKHIQSNRLYESTPAILSSSGFPKDFRSNADRLHDLALYAQKHEFKLLEDQWLGALKKHRFEHIPSGKIHESTPDNVLHWGFPKDLRKTSDRLIELSQRATENGYKLIDTDWRGNAAKYKFKKLDTGTHYEWRYTSIMQRGFPKDLRTPIDRLSAVQIFAQHHGFKLISDRWNGAGKKHQFEHIASGKMYSAAPNQIMGTSGFPKDLRNGGDLIQELSEQATKHGFNLLDQIWEGSKSQYQFEHVESGTTYKFMAANVMGPGGFPKDLRSDSNRIQELSEQATKHGFKLLNDTWAGSKSRYQFEHLESGTTYQFIAGNVLGPRGFPKDPRNDSDRIQELSTQATKHGFKLLDDIWEGSRSRYQFQHLESGTTYQFIAGNVLGPGGFPKDLRNDSDRIKELSEEATKNGFKLLDNIWEGSKHIYRFEHLDTGVTYQFVAGYILSKKGFPQDLRSDSDRVQELSEQATKYGFKLLDKLWRGVRHRYQFEHLNTGITYHFVAGNVMGPGGFPKDLRSDLDKFNDLVGHAQKNGFELLENEWLGVQEKHRFKHVESGATFEWEPAQILGKNRSFPKDLSATRQVFAHTEKLNKLKALASENGFELLDSAWKGAAKKHSFKHLATNTIYEWAPARIMAINSFPLMAGQRYVGEEICRQFMKHVFGGQFKTENQRLKEIHGKHLQLDGFESFSTVPPILYELGLNITEVAFEFQGHRAHSQDLDVIERDALRVQYCKELNILLVVIEKPEPWDKIRDADYMDAHISMAISKALNIQKIPNIGPGFKIDLTKWNPDLDLYNTLKIMSDKNGFLLLEDQWLGSNTKHRFRHIQSGSLYSSIPATLMRERGKFPKNFRTPAEDFNDMSIQANKSGFKLLEDKWLGSAKQHRFQHVASGKIYQFLPNNIKNRGFPKDSTLSTRCKPGEILDTSSASNKKPHTAEVEVFDNIGHLFFDVIPPAETFILPSCHVENINYDSTFGIA